MRGAGTGEGEQLALPGRRVPPGGADPTVAADHVRYHGVLAPYAERYTRALRLVRINYYPPRGDNIDIFGWMGGKMQI